MKSEAQIEFSRAFGWRLERLTYNRGSNPHALAHKMGIPQNTVYKWFSGSSTPNLYYVSLLAPALNTTTDYLAGLTEDD